MPCEAMSISGSKNQSGGKASFFGIALDFLINYGYFMLPIDSGQKLRNWLRDTDR